jgi:hypothetical protein
VPGGRVRGANGKNGKTRRRLAIVSFGILAGAGFLVFVGFEVFSHFGGYAFESVGPFAGGIDLEVMGFASAG